MPLKRSESKESTEFLSSAAKDYYKRHGHTRGIGRFLRGDDHEALSKAPPKASSDSSLQSFQDDEDTCPAPKEKAKSMENLVRKELSETSDSSSEVIPVVDESIQVETEDSPKAAPEPQNVNVNIESKIDLNMSQPSQNVPKESSQNFFPTYIFQSAPPPNPVVQQIFLHSMETQTSDVSEEPIQPVIVPALKEAPSALKEETSALKEETSPNSSIASKDQKLEWDSMADIGYNPDDPFLVCGPSQLESSEKQALLRYFEEKGLKFGKNVVVVKNTPKETVPVASQAPGTPKKVPRDPKLVCDRWKEIYHKYKDKYHESASQTTLNFDTPDAKSTPKTVQAVEKSAQTSLIANLCKSIQVGHHEETKSRSSSGKSAASTDSSGEQFVYVKAKTPVAESNQSTLKPTKKLPSVESSSSSGVPEAENSFEEELKMAIALMNSVLESKTMHKKLKKSLIGKIMQKIVNLKINNTAESQESQKSSKEESEAKETNSSKSVSKVSEGGQDTISSGKSMICYDEVASPVNPEPQIEPPKLPPRTSSTVSSKKSDTASRKMESLVQESLQPMTHSEIDFKIAKESTKSSSSSQASSGLNVIQYVKREKVAHLLWIEKEIDHLKKLKNLLTTAKNESQIYENLTGRTQSRSNSSNWGSHSNFNNNRSRLQTPNDEAEGESIVDSMEKRKNEFVKHYESSRRSRMESREQPFYTKPYSLYPKKSPTVDKPSSSDDFLSSGSVSIPIVTMTNTTTHQYDLKSTAARQTQTSDSILRTHPFLANKETKTQIVHKMKADKQMQTKPQAIAYNLTFMGDEEMSKELEKKPTAVPKKDEIEDSFDCRTLKEHLTEKRPQVWGRMDERNRCIQELRRLRTQRNATRMKLLLLTSEEVLKDRLEKMPPPPLSQKRIFSTKALRLHTRKQCENLSEVKRKKEIENINNLKKKNRLITNLFNKNLQRKVLRGQTDLSNSVHLFSKDY